MQRTRKIFCIVLALVLLLGSAIPTLAFHPFYDVPSESWYASYVEYVYEYGRMNGTSLTVFSPDSYMTRAMVVTVLHRLEGTPSSAAKIPFTDVPGGAYYTNAVRWSYEKGIVNGTSSTAFSPDVNITRQQLVTIFFRYAQSEGLDTSARVSLSGYTDQWSVADFAADAFRWAVACGIINGTSPSSLSPNGNATRAQCAAIIQRFIGWMNGDPAMPAGATLISNPVNYNYFNTSPPKNALQEISYWSGYEVRYKKDPIFQENRTMYTLGNMDKATAAAYVEMLQENGYTLTKTYSRQNMYSWGLLRDDAGDIPTIKQTYISGSERLCHVNLWHSDDGWFLYVSSGLNVTDLGIRRDGSIEDRRPWGLSSNAGLYRLADGRFQTTDGRLTASLGSATVLRDGVASTHPITMTVNADDVVNLRVFEGGDELIRFSFDNGTLARNTALRRQELEDEGYPTLRVKQDGKTRVLEWSSSVLRQATVRLMGLTEEESVFYIFASLKGSPSSIEVLFAIANDDVEHIPARDEDENDSGTLTPDHDNDYGSALDCTACDGTGRCSKCDGRGYLYSSASGEYDRNCYKCNTSRRCTTCHGSGKRYN